MQDIFRILARLMQTDLTVMISGESGTGKELVAKALHDYGKRKGGPFVAINMAAIPRDLIESELFAFTGAAARSVGRFEQAEGGTLFLDEIGDMPMEAQTRLLRVLQQGEYTTVGGRTPIKTNVRIVAATNKELRFSIQQGTFREDLFFRLNVVPIRLPPLRERPEDIPDLVRSFFQRGSSEGLPVKTFEPAAMERLRRYPWPGNVRELENLTRRLAALYPQEVIGEGLIESELSAGASPLFPPLAAADDGRKRVGQTAAQVSGDGFDAAMERAVADLFHSFGGASPQVGLYHRVLHDLEAPLIAATLTWTRGNQIKAAEILGLNRNTLRKKIRDLNLRGVASFR
jgi:two-component system, NtrC family, nitrogen regulation response regulator GlnG